MQTITLEPTDALLIIDLQNDFCPGGSLAVEDADDIIPGINALARKFQHVILTQDWHPTGHISFATTHSGKVPFETIEVPYGPQTLWPDHCVQGTHGAAFHPALDIPHAELILRKGYRHDMDGYSAILDNDHATSTGLTGYLRDRGLKRLFFAGLAFDFCVGSSAVDAANAGFQCLVVRDLTRAVDLTTTVSTMEHSLASAKVREIISTQIV